jgi:hypothetical protein
MTARIVVYLRCQETVIVIMIPTGAVIDKLNAPSSLKHEATYPRDHHVSYMTVFLNRWDATVGWVGREISKIIINSVTQNSPTQKLPAF